MRVVYDTPQPDLYGRWKTGIGFTVDNRWKVEYNPSQQEWCVRPINREQHPTYWSTEEFPTRQHAMAYIAAKEQEEFMDKHNLKILPEPIVETRTVTRRDSSGFGWGVAAGLVFGGGNW